MEPVAKLLTALMARTWTVYFVGFFTHSNGYGFQNPPNSPFQSIPCLHVLSFATGSLMYFISETICQLMNQVITC